MHKFQKHNTSRIYVNNMVKKKPKIIRQIGCKTVRDILTLSHGKFNERIEEYAKRTKTNILRVTEEYTSKTCGRCGFIDHDLDCKKVYNCSICGYKEDRDINGARNILIKMVSDRDHRERSIPSKWGIDETINMLKYNNNLRNCLELSGI